MKRKPVGLSAVHRPFWRKFVLAEDFSVLLRTRSPFRKINRSHRLQVLN